jgi:hypothetical protein
MMKLGTQTGSFFNHLMSNDITPPVVGKGATILLWSDRHAYFVDSVSSDGKEVTITRANPIREDQNGMCDVQEYRYERNTDAQLEVIKFTYGKWRRVYTNGWTGKKETQPINIIFGTMREYYDYSF